MRVENVPKLPLEDTVAPQKSQGTQIWPTIVSRMLVRAPNGFLSGPTTDDRHPAPLPMLKNYRKYGSVVYVGLRRFLSSTVGWPFF